MLQKLLRKDVWRYFIVALFAYLGISEREIAWAVVLCFFAETIVLDGMLVKIKSMLKEEIERRK